MPPMPAEVRGEVTLPSGDLALSVPVQSGSGHRIHISEGMMVLLLVYERRPNGEVSQ